MNINFKIIPAPQTYVLSFLVVALFLAATNIQSGWLYIIDSLLVSLLFFSLIIPLRENKKIGLGRFCEKIVFEDEFCQIRVELENKSKKIISFTRIRDIFLSRFGTKKIKIYPEKSDKFFTDIYPGEKKEYYYDFFPEIRGKYFFGMTELTSYGPFGLFRFVRYLISEDSIIVRPNIPIIGTDFFSMLKGLGYSYSAKTRNSPEASIPSNVRDYQRGDGIRMIHWRTTARMNKLMVKELETEQAYSIQILLDTEQGKDKGFGKENSFEYALKFAAALFKLACEKNYKTELLFYEKDKLIVFTDTTPWSQIIDELAVIEVDSNKKLRNFFKEKEIDSGSIIIPLFLHPDEQDINCLLDLSKNNYQIIPVFIETNSFDKNIRPVWNIMENSPYRYINISKGDNLKTKKFN